MAAFVPPFYTKFGKNLDDLLSKKFATKKEMKILSSADGGRLVFDSALSFNDKTATYGGALKVTEKLTDLGVAEVELDTAGKVKGTLELDRLAKGVTVKLAANEKPSGTLTLNYKQENFASTTSVDLSTTSTVLGQAAVVGIDGLSVGGHIDYDVTTQGIRNYNAGAEYGQADFTVTVQTQDMADAVQASFIHRLRNNINVGGRFLYNIATGNRVFTVASEWAVDKDTLVKGKVSSDGEVHAALEQRLRDPSLVFGLSTRFDLHGKAAAQEFGVSASFGDN